MSIDTSTTAGKIEVMQAHDRGVEIQAKVTRSTRNWMDVREVSWDWASFDYRIKPTPKEFYIVMDKNGPWRVHCNDARAHLNAEECEKNCPRDGEHYVIKVREVIE